MDGAGQPSEFLEIHVDPDGRITRKGFPQSVFLPPIQRRIFELLLHARGALVTDDILKGAWPPTTGHWNLRRNNEVSRLRKPLETLGLFVKRKSGLGCRLVDLTKDAREHS